MAQYAVLCIAMRNVVEYFERRTGAEAIKYARSKYEEDEFDLYVLVNEHADVQTTDTAVEPVSREEGDLLGDTFGE